MSSEEEKNNLNVESGEYGDIPPTICVEDCSENPDIPSDVSTGYESSVGVKFYLSETIASGLNLHSERQPDLTTRSNSDPSNRGRLPSETDEVFTNNIPDAPIDYQMGDYNTDDLDSRFRSFSVPTLSNLMQSSRHDQLHHIASGLRMIGDELDELNELYVHTRPRRYSEELFRTIGNFMDYFQN